MAADKLNAHLKMMLAIMEARLRVIKAQNNFLAADMNQFIRDNREYVCRQDPNLVVMDVNPYASMYVNPVLKNASIPGIQLFRHSDGATVIAVPKEQAYQLDEIKRQIDRQAKEFCSDFQTFKGHMRENDSILTVPQNTLTETQLFMLAAELTNAGAFYYIDPEKPTISYLASQKQAVTKAVYACSAELSSKDANYYAHYYAKTGALYEELSELGNTLSNGNCKYIVSEDRTDKNGVFALKIDNNSYTEVYKDSNGLIKENTPKYIDFNKESDVTLLCLQTLKYNKPLLIEQAQFEDRSVDNIKEQTAIDSFKNYGILDRNSNDELIVNFIRNAYKNGIKLDIYKKDINELYENIKEQCENSDNIKTKTAWDTIKDIPADDIKETLASYKNISYILDTNVLEKAEVETERSINKDRE